MTFLHPFALLGLLLLPLLVLLERWRRRARPTLWPSLALWRAAVRAAEAPARRRLEPLLLYECAAVLLLSLAAAGPAWRVGRDAGRLPVLLDEGPHMHALRADGATALEATRAEIARMGDRVEVYPVKDLRRAAAGWPADDVVVLATSLPDVEGPRRLVVGRAPAGDNLGIDAVSVDGDRMWFALATDGAARTVQVAVGENLLDVATGQGVTTDFAPSIEIREIDNYAGDNRVRLRRLALVGRNDTRSDLVRIALFRAGIRARPGDDPDLILTDQGGTPVEALVRGADCVAADPLFDGLLLDECVWEQPRTLPGDGLLLWRGRALAKWTDARTLWLGLPVDSDWDDHDTLAVLIERAKRARVRLGEGEALVGDAVAAPPPGHVRTKGVDRPWDGTLPKAGGRVTGATGLRTALALLAAGVLALYLRALRGGR
ncbi:MAG: BatA domain-containing protein [Planctomycetota bacterium]